MPSAARIERRGRPRSPRVRERDSQQRGRRRSRSARAAVDDRHALVVGELAEDGHGAEARGGEEAQQGTHRTIDGRSADCSLPAIIQPMTV
jgi:hypothetical protein